MEKKKQQSEQTKKRILDAAFKLLKTGGVESLTANQIAKTAEIKGISGLCYQRVSVLRDSNVVKSKVNVIKIFFKSTDPANFRSTKVITSSRCIY